MKIIKVKMPNESNVTETKVTQIVQATSMPEFDTEDNWTL